MIKKEVKQAVFEEFLLYLKEKISPKEEERKKLFEEFINYFQEKKVGIPISIFSKKLSSQESIVKFLRENKELSYKQIAEILKKNPGHLGVVYKNASKKHPKSLDISSQATIPLSIFNKKLTTFQSVVLYLKNSNYSIKKISEILHRNYKTIWTTYQIAKKGEKNAS